MEYRQIQSPVSSQLQASERILRHALKNRVHLLQTLYRSTPVVAGKKIRSTFFFLLAGLEDVGTPILPELAAAIEIFHLSSLIHDDIIDNSKLRRGRRTTSQAFGKHLSVLWGDFLFVSALSMMQAMNEERLIEIITGTAKTMIEGQILECQNSFNYRLSAPAYSQIIGKKTAALFGAIGRFVTILKHKGNSSFDDICRFTEDFGMMFQIRDDLLDIFSSHSGKDQFRDLKEGKITLPYILLQKRTHIQLRGKFSHADAARLRIKLREYNIENAVMVYLNRYRNRCLAFLTPYPSSPYKEALLGLIDFVGKRDY